ncbi:integral membrane protein 2B-like [Glandiceps talaboti]
MVKPTTVTPENAKKDEDLKKEKEKEADVPVAVKIVPDEAVTRPTAPRRTPCCTPLRCCVFGTFVLLLLAGIAVGGYLLARHMKGGKLLRCGVTYKDPSRHSGEEGEWHKLDEEFEINPEEQYERIEQPENDVCERITIMHDYNMQLSAYRLWTSGKCYIKELNITTGLRPEEFWEKLKDPEFFGQHFQALVETYRAVLPPLMNFRGLGMYIPLLCAGADTYWLEKIPYDELDKLLELAEDMMEEMLNDMDDLFDDDEIVDRKRRAIPALVEDIMNWTGNNVIDMKVIPPEVIKALEKAGELKADTPELTEALEEVEKFQSAKAGKMARK